MILALILMQNSRYPICEIKVFPRKRDEDLRGREARHVTGVGNEFNALKEIFSFELRRQLRRSAEFIERFPRAFTVLHTRYEPCHVARHWKRRPRTVI